MTLFDFPTESEGLNPEYIKQKFLIPDLFPFVIRHKI